MSNPSPIYNNPLAWWQDHLAKLEGIEQYMNDNGIPMTAADRAMIQVAREYVTRYVLEKLESANGDEGTA